MGLSLLSSRGALLMMALETSCASPLMKRVFSATAGARR